MSCVLVTGFGPFHEVTDNPSGRLAEAIDGAVVAGRLVRGVRLDVTYQRVLADIPSLVQRLAPCLVLATGVGRAGAARLELWARNRVDSARTDVDGRAPVGEPLVPGAPQRLGARWDAPRLAHTLDGPKLRVECSEDAGGYVCNAAYFALLHALPPHTPGGFLHIPGDAALPALLDLARRTIEAVLGEPTTRVH